MCMMSYSFSFDEDGSASIPLEKSLNIPSEPSQIPPIIKMQDKIVTESIVPLKLGLKSDPPSTTLIYRKNGRLRKRKMPIRNFNKKADVTQAAFSLRKRHEGYMHSVPSIVVEKVLRIIQEIQKGLSIDEAVEQVNAEFSINKHEDLNKLDIKELDRKKEIMNESFARHFIKPGDPEFVYDKRVDFKTELDENTWDDDDGGTEDIDKLSIHEEKFGKDPNPCVHKIDSSFKIQNDDDKENSISSVKNQNVFKLQHSDVQDPSIIEEPDDILEDLEDYNEDFENSHSSSPKNNSHGKYEREADIEENSGSNNRLEHLKEKDEDIISIIKKFSDFDDSDSESYTESYTSKLKSLKTLLSRNGSMDEKPGMEDFGHKKSISDSGGDKLVIAAGPGEDFILEFDDLDELEELNRSRNKCSQHDNASEECSLELKAADEDVRNEKNKASEDDGTLQHFSNFAFKENENYDQLSLQLSEIDEVNEFLGLSDKEDASVSLPSRKSGEAKSFQNPQGFIEDDIESHKETSERYENTMNGCDDLIMPNKEQQLPGIPPDHLTNLANDKIEEMNSNKSFQNEKLDLTSKYKSISLSDIGKKSPKNSLENNSKLNEKIEVDVHEKMMGIQDVLPNSDEKYKKNDFETKHTNLNESNSLEIELPEEDLETYAEELDDDFFFGSL